MSAEQHTSPCNYVEVLNAKVGRMEEELKDVDKKASIAEVLLARYERLLEKNTEAIESITGAITSIEKAIIGMQSEIRINAQATGELKDEVKEIKKNLEESEEKSKIDFRLILKEFFNSKLAWILGGGTITLVEIIRNWDKLSAIFK